MKPLAFDLEIYEDLFNGEEYTNQGIACAAIAYRDERNNPTVICFRNEEYGRMTVNDAIRMIDKIEAMVKAGYTLVTWNGLMFDLRIIAIESKQGERAARLAVDHIDIMFNIVATKGWPVSLEAACREMRTITKVHDLILSDGSTLNEMSGAIAPKLWREGEYEAVLQYQRGDVLALLALTQEIQSRHRLDWRSKPKPGHELGRVHCLTETEALAIVSDSASKPWPDQSWMDKPMPPEKFMGWIPKLLDDPHEYQKLGANLYCCADCGALGTKPSDIWHQEDCDPGAPKNQS